MENYSEIEVFEIIKTITEEDPLKIVQNYNTSKSNTPLDLSKQKYERFVYSFPVIIEDRNVALITLVDLFNFNDRDYLMNKYFGNADFERSYCTLSYDTYLFCYLTINESFELPEIVKGFNCKEFTSYDAKFNEFTWTVSSGYPEKESEEYLFYEYTTGSYRFDGGFSIKIDEFKDGWLLGEKINERIQKRINE